MYKLTDFGAAKQVHPDEEFYSIVGTEEYLFPEIYARAFFLPCDMNQRLTSDIDLWSIGATLYHVATGKVPFRPFGGRNNRAVMYDFN